MRSTERYLIDSIDLVARCLFLGVPASSAPPDLHVADATILDASREARSLQAIGRGLLSDGTDSLMRIELSDRGRHGELCAYFASVHAVAETVDDAVWVELVGHADGDSGRVHAYLRT